MAEENYDELDELGDIEKQGFSKNDLALSNVYNIKVGGFGNENAIRTYMCTVKVSDLQEDIEFYEKLTKDKSWPVSQIIQREVDRTRVSNISKEYILGQGRAVKYFPPIIVAILPKDSEGKIDMKLNFQPDQTEQIKRSIYERSIYRSNDKIEKYFLNADNKSLIDGLYVLEVSKIFDFNLLCWDRSKYYAIVIDGQHRLASLIKSRRDNPAIGNYTQDVVFMDFSSLIARDAEKYSPIEVVRRVFIDINTNAKKVGVVRQILMDDKDLAALFVQSLVDSVRHDGSLKSEDSYLISQIVDWYGESLKHTLPHITGILSLYQIMDDYLIQGNLSSIKDLRSQSKVNAWVTTMNDIFSVDQKISTKVKYKEVTSLYTSLNKYLAKVEDADDFEVENEDQDKQDRDDESRETEIFSYDYSVLDIAQETFEEKFLRPLVKVFSELIPYKETLAIIKELGGLDSESILSKALISSPNKVNSDSILKDKLSELRRILEEQLYNKYYHIFTVLGQKVIFSLLFQRILQRYSNSTTEAEILQIASDFLTEINRLLQICTSIAVNLFDKREKVTMNTDQMKDDLVDLGTIATFFWEGIIYEDGKIIYNTQGIRSLSSFVAYMLQRIDEIIAEKEQARPFVVSYLSQRVKRILKRKYANLDDIQISGFTAEIINAKEAFLEAYLSEAVDTWKLVH